jgi:hypothetical protein
MPGVVSVSPDPTDLIFLDEHHFGDLQPADGTESARKLQPCRMKPVSGLKARWPGMRNTPPWRSPSRGSSGAEHILFLIVPQGTRSEGERPWRRIYTARYQTIGELNPVITNTATRQGAQLQRRVWLSDPDLQRAAGPAGYQGTGTGYPPRWTI